MASTSVRIARSDEQLYYRAGRSHKEQKFGMVSLEN